MRIRRVATPALVAGLLVAAAGRASAQARTVANLVVGDAVMVVQVAPDKQVYVGIGTGTHTTALTATAPAVDQFVAETEAIVRWGARPLPVHLLDRPELVASDSSGVVLSVTRHLERHGKATELTYHFFVSETRLAGYALPASPVETNAVLQALHHAARVASGGGATTGGTKAKHPPVTRPK